MKKILILVVMGAFSHISNAQNNEGSITTSNDTVVSQSSQSSIEDRLAKQEQEVQLLKKENQSLKKQVKQLKSAFNIGGSSKTTVSRRGSKQLITE